MKKIIIPFLIIIMISSCGGPSARHEQPRKNAEGSMKIGHAYLMQGDYTSALRNLLKAEKTITNDPFLEDDLGLVFMAKKRFDLAEKHFKKAIRLKPDYIPARNNLGASYMKQKKWDQAIACFKEISGNLLYATPHYPLSNMGWAYMEKKNYPLAKKNFIKAIKLSPDFVQAIHGLATLFIRTGQGYSAVDLLTGKIKRNPGAVILHTDIAKAYEMVHRFLDAKKSWKTVIKLAPDSELAKEAKTHIAKLNAMP